MRNVKRVFQLMVVLAVIVFAASTVLAFEFDYEYPVITSKTQVVGTSTRLFAADRYALKMFRAVDPAVYTEPFQDSYGTVNIPLGYNGPLTVHVKLTYVNTLNSVVTLTGAYPNTWTQKLLNASCMLQSTTPSQPYVGVFWYSMVSTRSDITLQPTERVTVPFFDIHLGTDFSIVPAYQSATLKYNAYQIKIGDVTWADPTAMVTKMAVQPVTAKLTAVDVISSKIADVTTEPEDPGKNVIDVDVDIQPGDSIGAINRRSSGVLPVKILYSSEYDVLDIVPGKTMFASTYPVHWAYEYDGLILHYDIRRCNIPDGSTKLALTGEMADGERFEGSDAVRIVK